MKKLLLLLGLVATAALAQKNSYQEFQPHRSNYIQRAVSCEAPDAPSNLAATQPQENTIHLTWDDNSSNEDEFSIQRCSGAACSNFAEIATASADAESYDDTTGVLGTSYSYQIIAANCGESDPTSSATIVPVYVESNSDSNVIALWKFDEGSGNIVDEIFSTTLTPVRTPTYGVTATGLFANISPGITYEYDGGGTPHHIKAGDDANLDIGTSDFTVEIYYKSTSTTNNGHAIDLADSGGTERGLRMHFQFGAENLFTHIQSEDDVAVDSLKALGSDLHDGNIHKIRVSVVRSGSATVYYDGVSKGTFSVATLSGKDIKCHDISVGMNSSEVQGLQGTLFTVRIVKNSSANLGGPGGG